MILPRLEARGGCVFLSGINARVSNEVLMNINPSTEWTPTERLAVIAELGDCGRALKEYAGARDYAKQTGDRGAVASFENNIAFILCQLGRMAEAHERLGVARNCSADPVKLAEIDDTEAQVYLREGRAREAYALALQACVVFMARDEERLLRAGTRVLLAAGAAYANDVSQ